MSWWPPICRWPEWNKIVEFRTKMCSIDENVVSEEQGERSEQRPVPSPRLSPGGQGRARRPHAPPLEQIAALEVHYSSMRQRHDLVQTAAVVGFGHLRIGQVGKRDARLGISPGVRGPCPTVAEGIGRGGAAKAANQRGGTAYVYA